MITIVRFLEMLALGVWLGSMVFLAFGTAPVAFQVAPTRELAGAIVGQSLTRLYILSYVCAALFLLGVVVEQQLTGKSFGEFAGPIVLVVVMTLLIVANHQFIGVKLGELRGEMTAAFGSIDATPKDNVLRQTFGRLHGVSFLLLMGDMLLGLAALYLNLRRLR